MNDKTDLLWKIIGRIDQYIVSTNQKATATIAYNTLVVGGVILKHADILGLFAGSPGAAKLAGVILVIITGVSLVSLWCTFMMILPYTWSPKKGDSALFYADIAEHDNGAKYLKQIEGLDDQTRLNQLAVQVYAVARGATKKFRWMWVGIFLIVWVQLPALALLFITRLFVM